ncbi:MAG: hypothetical protein ACOH1T_08230 [Microbacteriaceae bacterium]
MGPDVTRILGLDELGGRVLLTFYGLATTLVALLNLSGLIHPATGIASLVLLWTALVVLALPGREPFALGLTVALVTITTAITAISSWSIIDASHPGYATWHMGSVTFILLVLALRGRPGYAWIGFSLFAAITMLWTVTADQSAIGGLNNVARQAATLLIGTLFARFLTRASRTMGSIQQKQLERTAEQVARLAEAEERELHIARLERDARPALERIVSGEPMSDSELADLLLLEAALRDGIRAAGFSSERLAAETRAARQRGIRVILLDDRGADLDDADRERVEDALIAELRASRRGAITARLSPYGREDVATIVIDEDGAFRRIVIGLDAEEVTYLP